MIYRTWCRKSWHIFNIKPSKKLDFRLHAPRAKSNMKISIIKNKIFQRIYNKNLMEGATSRGVARGEQSKRSSFQKPGKFAKDKELLLPQPAVSLDQGRSQHGARGGNCPPNLGRCPPPQSGLAPATVVSLRLAMRQLRLEKCIKTKK